MKYELPIRTTRQSRVYPYTYIVYIYRNSDWHVCVAYRDVFILIAVGGEGWLSLEAVETQSVGGPAARSFHVQYHIPGRERAPAGLGPTLGTNGNAMFAAVLSVNSRSVYYPSPVSELQPLPGGGGGFGVCVRVCVRVRVRVCAPVRVCRGGGRRK